MHPRMFLPAAVVSAVIGYVEEVAQGEIVLKLRATQGTDRFTKFEKLRKSHGHEKTDQLSPPGFHCIVD